MTHTNIRNMNIKRIKLTHTDSTNNWLKGYKPSDGEEMTVVSAEYQTAGRGQGCNVWESEEGQNLLFSILIHPHMVPVRNQFLLSEAGAVALKMALSHYISEDSIQLKWPNDIYWKDRKLSGTLIESTISGSTLSNTIYGIGLNVNQRKFLSDAPNPVSLHQILGYEINRDDLLEKIIQSFETCYSLVQSSKYMEIAAMYHSSLFWREGFHKFEDKDGIQEYAIVEVEDDGHLIVRDRNGVMHSYAFKELKFIIE